MPFPLVLQARRKRRKTEANGESRREMESERRSEYCSKYTVEQLRGWMDERSIDIADRVIDGWGAYRDW